jgi:hypothetical protein
VFENRVLRRIFGPKRDEETGGCRNLHNEELHSLCSSPDIIRVIKSRRLRWAGHVARMGAMKVRRTFWLESLKERDYSEDVGIDGRIILKCILEKQGLGVDWIHLAQDRD